MIASGEKTSFVDLALHEIGILEDLSHEIEDFLSLQAALFVTIEESEDNFKLCEY